MFFSMKNEVTKAGHNNFVRDSAAEVSGINEFDKCHRRLDDAPEARSYCEASGSFQLNYQMTSESLGKGSLGHGANKQ